MPWEVSINTRRVVLQNNLSADDYSSLMNVNTEDLTEHRLWALEKIKENKATVARVYNKKVRPKSFQVGDLIWELVLPIGSKDPAYGKGSPNWHGPYRIEDYAPGNSYCIETLEGVRFSRNAMGST